jgi:hypothetical protein
LTIEYTSAEDAGTSYPTTTIRVKPNESPLVEDETQVKNLLENQTEITDLYQELSYDELKDVLESWLNPNSTGEESGESSVSQESLTPSTPKQSDTSTDMGGSVDNTPPFEPDNKTETSKKTDDVASAFDELFNG